jgi:hypothetical protein
MALSAVLSGGYRPDMRKILIPLAAALAVAALPVAEATAAKPKLHVFFPGDCITNVYKPRHITVACADAGWQVAKIKWAHYGAKSAVGSGTSIVNDCTPNCASGAFHQFPSKVRLSRVRQCGDVPQFTRLRIHFTGKRPKGLKRTWKQKYPCANAPS